MDINTLWDEMYSNKIYPEKEVKDNRVLLKYEGNEVFAEGTLSCITAQAKQRKTFFLSLLVEQLLTPTHNFTTDYVNPEIVWIDTEMSEKRLIQLSQRFSRPEQMHFFSIRQYSIKERFFLIEESLKRIKPDLLVIDGIRELVADINNQEYASRLLNELLKWSTVHKTHITSVLHQNPGSDRLRGAVGTEMLNKSSLVMKVETRGPISRASTVMTRDMEVAPIKFTIGENAKPIIKE